MRFALYTCERCGAPTFMPIPAPTLIPSSPSGLWEECPTWDAGCRCSPVYACQGARGRAWRQQSALALESLGVRIAPNALLGECAIVRASSVPCERSRPGIGFRGECGRPGAYVLRGVPGCPTVCADCYKAISPDWRADAEPRRDGIPCGGDVLFRGCVDVAEG